MIDRPIRLALADQFESSHLIFDLGRRAGKKQPALEVRILRAGVLEKLRRLVVLRIDCYGHESDLFSELRPQRSSDPCHMLREHQALTRAARIDEIKQGGLALQ